MADAYYPELDHFELYHLAQEEESKTSVLGGPALPALGHAVSGAAGSAISNVITYPLSLVVTRLQTQHQFKTKGDRGDADDYKDVIDAARRIYAEEGGISAFYAGCTQDTLKTMTDSFLFFLAYNFIRRTRLGKAKRLPIHEELGVGMLAGAFAKFITSPVSQIVTRKQVASMVAARDSTITISSELSAKDIALQIRHEKGILGFWSGYSASLILTINPSLTFLLHETFLRLLVKREKRSNPGSLVTFLIAAVSKAIASTITYPFQLAKSRAQVSKQSRSEESDEPVSKKDSTVGKAQKPVKNLEHRTIFHSVANIAREEGIVGLYQGLGGEIVKGFFSHGLTMLTKERIHVVVIQLYYLVLKLLRRYPSPEELAALAKERVSDVTNETVKAVQTSTKAVGKEAKTALDKVTTQSQQLMERGVETMAQLYREGKESAKDLIDEYTDIEDE